MDKQNTILEVKKLKKTFNKDLLRKPLVAISDINCKFIEGTINSVIGHNGAGKTTTLRIILGLIHPDHGQVLFKNKPISLSDRFDFGYMPEIHRLSGLLTPYETLKCHLRYFAKKPMDHSHKELIQDRLQQLGVWQHRNKKVKELSKGLQRRLAYCLATIHKPKFLILDEPFSGLDPIGHELLEELLLLERKKSHTIIMSSHNISAMVKICDHYHVLSNGVTVHSSLEERSQVVAEESFRLVVSGIEGSQIKDLIKRFPELSQYLDHYSNKFNHTFVYPNYIIASTALKTFINNGYIVSSFCSDKNIDEQKILGYFKEAELSKQKNLGEEPSAHKETSAHKKTNLDESSNLINLNKAKTEKKDLTEKQIINDKPVLDKAL